MTHLYLARHLLPIAEAPVEDGALLVRDGRIAAVGRRDEVVREAGEAPVTDYGDAILLPPLVNAHTHLELTHFPDWAAASGPAPPPPEDFVAWILAMIRVRRSVPVEAFAPSLAAGIRESLRSGTGVVGDILSQPTALEALAGTPLLGKSFLEILGRSRDQWHPRLETVRGILDGPAPGRLTFGLSPHSLYTLSAEALAAVLETGRTRRLPLAIHLAESAAETELIERAAGPLVERLYPEVGWENRVPPPADRSPVAELDARGGLGPQALLVHGVQVDREDIALIARRHASVVLCPRSNRNLDVGRAPVEDYLAAGINLALGTDSRASCESLSVWDEIAFALDWFGGALIPRRALEMATRGGARALGLEGETGTLTPGRGGHFQVLRPPTGPRPGELWDYLGSGCGGDVRHLVLDGEDVLQKD